MKQHFQIAIDGPVAAGCSTVARILAERLGFLYVDTGAMYRTAALIALRAGVDVADEAAVVELVKKADFQLLKPTPDQQDGRLITVMLGDEDISWKIRTDAMSRSAAVVAKQPRLREVLVKKQQQIATEHDVVMEGRDITYKVLPAADIKIYLTASDVVRAKRRHIQEQSKGRDVDFQTTYEELLARDKTDMERQTDPLQIVDDAIVIDTSDLSIDKVAAMIEARVRALRS
jgi:cytidylate kinase